MLCDLATRREVKISISPKKINGHKAGGAIWRQERRCSDRDLAWVVSHWHQSARALASHAQSRMHTATVRTDPPKDCTLCQKLEGCWCPLMKHYPCLRVFCRGFAPFDDFLISVPSYFFALHHSSWFIIYRLFLTHSNVEFGVGAGTARNGPLFADYVDCMRTSLAKSCCFSRDTVAFSVHCSNTVPHSFFMFLQLFDELFKLTKARLALLTLLTDMTKLTRPSAPH